MVKLRFDGANIYVRSGLILLGIAVVAVATLLFMHPTAAPTRLLLVWLTSGSFLGGIILYFIGRVSYVAKRRDAA